MSRISSWRPLSLRKPGPTFRSQKETGSERLSDIPKVTQRSGAELGVAQSCLLQGQSSLASSLSTEEASVSGWSPRQSRRKATLETTFKTSLVPPVSSADWR